MLALYEVLFETTTGRLIREQEREEEIEADRQSAAYRRSVKALQRRQEEP